MGHLTLKTKYDKYLVYPIHGKYLIVHERPPSRGHPMLTWTPELADLLREILVGDDRLYHQASQVVFVTDGRPTVCNSPEEAWMGLHDIVSFGIHHVKEAKALTKELSIPVEAQTVESEYEYLSLILKRHDIIPVQLTPGSCRYVSTLAMHGVPNTAGFLGILSSAPHPRAGFRRSQAL